jgi:hypothetical protein
MKEKALQVLLAEENPGHARLLPEMSGGRRPDSFELTHLLRKSEARIHLGKCGVDVAPLDMGLADRAWSRSRASGARGARDIRANQ